MGNSVILTCPACGGHKIIDNRALYATVMRVDKPDDEPKEVRLKMYTCLSCDRTFNELEGRGNNKKAIH